MQLILFFLDQIRPARYHSCIVASCYRSTCPFKSPRGNCRIPCCNPQLAWLRKSWSSATHH